MTEYLYYRSAQFIAALTIVVLLPACATEPTEAQTKEDAAQPDNAILADDDVANERIPTTLEQREQHWQVDCTRLRRFLMHAPTGQLRLTNLMRFSGELERCAAIHNTPGTPASDDCPNYAGVISAMNNAMSTGRHKLRRSDVTALLGCQP